jgi:transcriptional repressor NF-X1
LECNDECLRLQRNAKLAAALNIDPATHIDDHIPYSAKTLELFRESTKFCQIYEREFRVFAADEKEKRLRFKPMKANQREFIHSLAEDFGLDSESQDPEPHRHVCIFKTPRFVSAPMKTLAQCVKPKAVVAEPAPSSSSGLMVTAEPFNAL